MSAKMTAFAGGVGGTAGIGGHPAVTVCFSRRAETLAPWKFFFSFLAALCASRRVFFFSSEVILQSLTKCFWLHSGFRQSGSLGFSPLPEVGYGEEENPPSSRLQCPWHGFSWR